MNTQENNKMIAKDLDNNKYEILWGDDKPFQSGDMAYNPMSGIVIEVYFDENDEWADDEYYVQETYAQVKKLSPYPYDEGDDYWTIEDSQVIWSCWDEQSEDMHDENPTKKYFNTDIDAVRYAISKGIKITRIDKLNGDI